MDLSRIAQSPPHRREGPRRDRQGFGRHRSAGLASRLFDAIDPDALSARVPKDTPEPEQRKARDAAKDDAAVMFDDPTLRRRLKDVKAATDIRIALLDECAG